jgi:spore coat protein U-like protein
MNLGTYTQTLDTTGAIAITVNCTSGVTFNIALNAGSTSGGTITNRRVKASNGSTVFYQLFSNSGRTNNWGQTVGTDTVAGTGTGSNQNFTVYPSMAATQWGVAGSYSDTMTVTVTSPTTTTVTTTFAVSAVLPSNCNISATDLAFGGYTGAQTTQTSTVSIVCTHDSTFYINLNYGLTPTGTVPNMVDSNSVKLSYELFQDSGFTTVWGNTVNSNGQGGTALGHDQDFTVYGEIFAGQNVEPGSYGDTITATITF